jgi:ribA/ribD-fused uncharacterized protein
MILFWGAENPNGFMSNFYPSPFEAEGHMWPTVEHYFQAMKTLDKSKWSEFAALDDPLKTKKMGRKVALRSDWEDVKVEVMNNALRYKFKQNPLLLKLLLETNDKVLHEDSPYDFVWGWQNNGKDLLGKCLMKVRDELRQEAVLPSSSSR